MDSQHHENRGHHRASATVGATTVYTCQMHPEVRQGQPGNCPKCGMHLSRRAREQLDARVALIPPAAIVDVRARLAAEGLRTDSGQRQDDGDEIPAFLRQAAH